MGAQNPFKFLDKDGRDIIVVNRTLGASGNGHNAVLIGNKQDGYYFYSKDGVVSANMESLFGVTGVGLYSMERFDSIEQFFESDFGKSYDRAVLLYANQEQDNAMTQAVLPDVITMYDLFIANCNHLTLKALNVLGMGNDVSALRPNDTFEKLEEKVQENQALGKILPNKLSQETAKENTDKFYPSRAKSITSMKEKEKEKLKKTGLDAFKSLLKGLFDVSPDGKTTYKNVDGVLKKQ